MSWAEVKKINNNMKKSLNEQMRDIKFQPMRVITSSTTYSPEKTGIYKVICVGAGGNGGYGDSSNTYGGGGGGGGGVAIKTLRLVKGTSYQVTASSTASFVYNTSTIITAGSGGTGSYSGGGSGGSASGGDYNYTGTSGQSNKLSRCQAPLPGSVGVAISDLTRTPSPYTGTLVCANQTYIVTYIYGDCILNYGGGGTGAGYYANIDDKGGYATNGKPASVIIIPLELEE